MTNDHTTDRFRAGHSREDWFKISQVPCCIREGRARWLVGTAVNGIVSREASRRRRRVAVAGRSA